MNHQRYVLSSCLLTNRTAHNSRRETEDGLGIETRRLVASDSRGHPSHIQKCFGDLPEVFFYHKKYSYLTYLISELPKKEIVTKKHLTSYNIIYHPLKNITHITKHI